MMHSSIKVSLIVCLLQALLLCVCSARSMSPTVDKSSTDIDKPIDLDRLRCPQGMEKTSKPNVSGTIDDCQCQRGKFFYQPTKSCYFPYLREPCKSNEYGVPSGDQIELLCEENPCEVEGMVPFQGGCYRLDEQGPCTEYFALKFNPLTSKLDCTFDVKYAPSSVLITPRKCPEGTLFTGAKCARPL